jgi:A/G-specific adenine glycosylase
MAQQTQIDRVVLFYNKWIREYPTFASLSSASKKDILRHWSGGGYNSRAIRLHELARQVVHDFGGTLPRSVKGLLGLPGIGKYTAHAVACLAFGLPVPVVDVNIRRIYTRVLQHVETPFAMMAEKEAWKIAARYLPRRVAAEWNQALMDLGARVCTARNPDCTSCPLNSLCRSAFSSAFVKKYPPREKREPSYKGTPRRIYRGRILKALHDKPLTPRQLGEMTIDNFHPRDLRWIIEVLETMERDSLISLKGNGAGMKVMVAR